VAPVALSWLIILRWKILVCMIVQQTLVRPVRLDPGLESGTEQRACGDVAADRRRSENGVNFDIQIQAKWGAEIKAFAS
jgi:hypothetical protein